MINERYIGASLLVVACIAAVLNSVIERRARELELANNVYASLMKLSEEEKAKKQGQEGEEHVGQGAQVKVGDARVADNGKYDGVDVEKS